MDKYGIFINIMVIAFAMIATFSTLLLKMLGKMNQWTWLTDDSPSFLVKTGPRIISVGFMAVTYVTINNTNYIWFGVVAVLIGLFGFWSVIRFDHLRKIHIVSIPLIDAMGKHLLNKRGVPQYKNVVIGLEDQLESHAKTAFENARKSKGGVSLVQFMTGYGANKVNDPGALWDRETLADASNKLTMTLMFVILSAVMSLFLAAFVINVAP